jgi:hypothetical protein
MTRKSWETMGGLLGICISLKEAYLNEITFHAPCDVVNNNLISIPIERIEYHSRLIY